MNTDRSSTSLISRSFQKAVSLCFGNPLGRVLLALVVLAVLLGFMWNTRIKTATVGSWEPVSQGMSNEDGTELWDKRVRELGQNVYGSGDAGTGDGQLPDEITKK